MSNIEEDIKRCEKLTEPQNANWIGISNQLAIAGVLVRIKELEENKKYIVQLTDEQYRNLVDTIRKKVKQEFEQKVKEILDKAELMDYYTLPNVIEDLEKLVEDK